RTHKHPKLSTQIAHLRRAVSQNMQPPAPGERIASPPGFAVGKLPKSIRDAVRAGQMHITNDAEVQVYISVSEISERNLEQLRLCGVVIQLVGSPDQKPGKTGKLAGVPAVFNGVPTVQGLLPVTMIDQVAAL